MIKGKSLPIGTLVMVLVIMLALLGVGYALWADWLVVEGEVHTGSVDMKFVECEVDDQGIDPGYEKDVASCSCNALAHEPDSSVDAGPDRLKFTIRGGYPSYTCTATYTMRSVGTVPVHLYSVNMDYDPNWIDVEEECDGEEPYQLHQGDQITCTTSIHVKQHADEGQETYLNKEYFWGQYNEEVIRVSSADAGFYGPWGPYGWAGWSCPSTHPDVVGGGWLPGPGGGEGDVEYSGPAQPGESGGNPVETYPDYPHWCFSDDPLDCTYTGPASRDETGWVVQNDNDSGEYLEIYALCAGPVSP